MPQVTTPNPAAWKSALLRTYDESQQKDEGDGTSHFMAKFKTTGAPLAFGTRDAFRHLRIYSAGLPHDDLTGIKVYISVPDGEMPLFFLHPVYIEHTWLFMKKIAVMADGEVAFEHECGNVERDTREIIVVERCDFIATTDELTALRKVAKAKTVIVRFSGAKGYTNLNKLFTAAFVSDVSDALAMYDAIASAVRPYAKTAK